VVRGKQKRKETSGKKAQNRHGAVQESDNGNSYEFKNTGGGGKLQAHAMVGSTYPDLAHVGGQRTWVHKILRTGTNDCR